MAVHLTSTLPSFSTPKEHATIVSSTPQNFSDIPPVLRHQQKEVHVRFEAPLESKADWQQGTLYVIDSILAFVEDGENAEGWQIEYPAITLHAISKAEGGIYCQLDDKFGLFGAEEEEEEVMRELTIVPKDSGSLDAIFEALSRCASLHPDEPSPSDDEDEAFVDADEFQVSDGTEEQELSKVGRVRSDFINDSRYQPY
ncbi:regulator of volume decrease after cellular swelling-domain-containing protein [Desarmillaria ectypa]|nr:regulator of volume decrease after cellular swelling-domain-containing protein [Desarmillaria ectypa]